MFPSLHGNKKIKAGVGGELICWRAWARGRSLLLIKFWKTEGGKIIYKVTREKAVCVCVHACARVCVCVAHLKNIKGHFRFCK